eukprot:gene45075-61058_t
MVRSELVQTVSSLLTALILMGIGAIPLAIFLAVTKFLSKPRARDITHVKALLEVRGRKVRDIRFERFYRGAPPYVRSYRVYRAIVSYPQGGPDKERLVAIWANIFGVPAPEIWER